jgi:hypothetical protein
VPFLVRWPGNVPAGLVDTRSIVTAVDLLPTFAEVAGAKLPQGYEQYENNLRNIVIYLIKIAPSAKLIFAATTPIPEGAQGRFTDDAVHYNRAALKILKEFPEVIINDLYAFIQANHKNWWKKAGNVHYNELGRKAQGNEVTQHVLSQLANK